MDTSSDSFQAAEYALGLLHGEVLFKFEKRLKQDRSLAEDVAYWEDSLVSTLLDVEAEVPPKDIMQRVESSLFGSPEKQTNPFFGQRRGHADNGKAFPWKKFAVGVVVVKLSLLSAWYVSQSARAADDVRPGQTLEAPVSN